MHVCSASLLRPLTSAKHTIRGQNLLNTKLIDCKFHVFKSFALQNQLMTIHVLSLHR